VGKACHTLGQVCFPEQDQPLDVYPAPKLAIASFGNFWGTLFDHRKISIRNHKNLTSINIDATVTSTGLSMLNSAVEG
jgi:hypothetical protein